MKRGHVSASFLLAAFALPVVLHFHLLPAVLAGLAVHVLTCKLARRLPATWGGWAHEIALIALTVLVISGLTGIILGLWALLRGDGGMAALLLAVAETIGRLRQFLPGPIADALPSTVSEMHEPLAEMLREHGRKISAVGIAGIKTFLHVLFGMVIGGLTALHKHAGVEDWPPLAAALHDRAKALADAFDKVVFAQVKISALNTLLTAVYLLVVLRFFGVDLPLLTVLISLTFVVGLLPVVGNLISNTAIVLISFSISPGVAVSSLVFLVAIHKLEYFTNARIVGGQVQARAWELLCAMLTMEAVFGLPGLVAAPVAYAWLKAELKREGLI